MRDGMPVSLWLKWVAWAKFQGPFGGLRDDYHAADTAMRVSVPFTAEKDRHIAKCLPPWRRPSDYSHWDRSEPERVEYSVE